MSSSLLLLLLLLLSSSKPFGAQEALVFPADFSVDSSATHLAAFVTRHFNQMDVLVLNMIKPFYGPWSSVATVTFPRA